MSTSEQNAKTFLGNNTQNKTNNYYGSNDIISRPFNFEVKDKRVHVKYLSSDELPYISRSQFKKDNGKINDKFESEIDLYNQIFNENKYHGLIIWGEGGLGKTRLMRELAGMANENTWHVYEIISNNIAFDSFPLDDDKKYCFIIDYIEEKNFDIAKIRDFVTRYDNVKVIANARNISIDNNNINTDNSNFRHFTIDIVKNENEKLYIQYIVKKILAKKNISNIPIELLRKPSFAVFIVDILNRYPDDTNILDSLKHENDFGDYINKRLSICLGNNTNNLPVEIYYIFASLPIKQPLNQILQYCQNLDSEGWILYDIETDSYQTAYNDTIIDAIINYHFKHINPNQIMKQLRDYFSFGVEHHTLGAIIRAFNRAKLKISSKIFYTIYSENLDGLSECINQVIRTSTLDEADKIRLIYENRDRQASFKGIVENKFINVLATAIRKLARINQKDDYIEGIYKEWRGENESLYNKPIMVMAYIIESHILYFGIDEFITKAINNWQKTIVENKAYYETSFIIRAILELKEENVELVKLVENLSNVVLSNAKKEKSFTYIARAYLKFLDSKSITIVIDWINENIDNHSSSFLLQPYLEDKTKNFELIKDSVVKWIKLNENRADTTFTMIVGSYFKRGGEIYELEESLSGWINQYINYKDSSFVVGGFLEHSGNPDTIKESFIRWIGIEENIANSKASFPIEEYLKRTEDLKSIKQSVIKWINIHGHIQNKDEIEASYVIQSYFEFGGKLKPIKEKVVEWINNNYNLYNETFSMIAKSYFKRQGDLKPVKSAIEQWIIKSSDKEYASFVIPSYLKNVDNIKSYELDTRIVNWIIKFQDEKYASFVIQSYLEKQVSLNSHEFKSSVIKWINKYGTDKNSGRIIEKYLRLTKDLQSIKNVTLFWIKTYSEEKVIFQSIVKYYCKSGGTYKELISTYPHFSFIEQCKIIYFILFKNISYKGY